MSGEAIHWTGPRFVAGRETWTVELPWGVYLKVTRHPRIGPVLEYFEYQLTCEELASWDPKDGLFTAQKAGIGALRVFAAALTEAADRIQTPEEP